MEEKNTTLKDIIKEIDFRLTHLEDMEYDNRKLMLKLVQQGNTIVEFLKQLEVSEPTVGFEEEFPFKKEEPMDTKEGLLNSLLERSGRILSIKELVSDFMDKHKELKELEEELQKHKKDITPGQVGDA